MAPSVEYFIATKRPFVLPVRLARASLVFAGANLAPPATPAKAHQTARDRANSSPDSVKAMPLVLRFPNRPGSTSGAKGKPAIGEIWCLVVRKQRLAGHLSDVGANLVMAQALLELATSCTTVSLFRPPYNKSASVSPLDQFFLPFPNTRLVLSNQSSSNLCLLNLPYYFYYTR